MKIQTEEPTPPPQKKSQEKGKIYQEKAKSMMRLSLRSRRFYKCTGQREEGYFWNFKWEKRKRLLERGEKGGEKREREREILKKEQKKGLKIS